MAKQLHDLGRRAVLAAGTILLGAVGCAFPHGSTGGDPILGSFNRPIVPTPPPERGGLGLDSPAYDAGARIGMSSPDIPTPFDNTSGFQSLPSLTSPNLFSGVRTPFGSPTDSTTTRRPVGADGARLPALPAMSMRLPPSQSPTQMSSDAVIARPRDSLAFVTTSTSFDPVEPTPPLRLAGHKAPRDPGDLTSLEDAQAHLQNLGARGQRSEQLPNGDWFFSCVIDSKVYESRGHDQFEAMKKAAEQAKRDR